MEREKTNRIKYKRLTLSYSIVIFFFIIEKKMRQRKKEENAEDKIAEMFAWA